MTVVVDTSFVLALYDADDVNHAAATAWLLVSDEDLITTPLTLAELDYLIGAHGGEAARGGFWLDLDSGAFGVRWWAGALAEILGITRRHPFLGLTDCSLVALSGLLRTTRIATFDQHFRSVPPPGGEAFVVLPADA
ncbi:MAG TPA: PIN domain-containing protein [Methylomirabilota bacterium]|nr:PIN domain-containing protein [Methylomirabilota bacterium]